MAAANVGANDLTARVGVIVADVLADRRARRQAGLVPASADLVLMTNERQYAREAAGDPA